MPLRFTRARKSFSSSSRLINNLSSRTVSALTLGLCGALMLAVVGGVRAEKRDATPVHSALTSRSTATLGGAMRLSGPRYELRMHHLHTGENIDVVYRVGNTYIPSAIAELNHFLRDHRTQAQSHYDVREFDLLHNVMTKLGRPDGVIDIVCGYRTPWSNNSLRTRSADTGVAKNSQHMQAKAIDIRIPGVSTAKLRDVAMSFQAGGVGYYPLSQFVHVDVGPVRHWTFAGGE